MNKNNNISLVTLFSVTFFSLISSANVVADAVIDRADKAEAACKELSEESLTEMGLEPHSWHAESSNDSRGFAIEGRWQTKNGTYRVECEVGFGQTFDDVEVSISKG